MPRGRSRFLLLPVMMTLWPVLAPVHALALTTWDEDGDGIPNAVEDRNGDGVVDVGETDDRTLGCVGGHSRASWPIARSRTDLAIL